MNQLYHAPLREYCFGPELQVKLVLVLLVLLLLVLLPLLRFFASDPCSWLRPLSASWMCRTVPERWRRRPHPGDGRGQSPLYRDEAP